MEYKNNVILLGAFAVTSLLIFPPLLITIANLEFQVNYGVSSWDMVLYSTVLFLFSWLILSFNIKWKNSWFALEERDHFIRDIIINIAFLLVAVACLTILKKIFNEDFKEIKWFFLINFFIHLIVLCILLLLSWLIIYFESSKKNSLEKEVARQNALHHQLETLKGQINPHFLFNSLNSLKSLIIEKSDKADNFVDKLSWLLAQTLQKSEKEYLSIKEEMEYLDAYVYLQKERFDEKLNIDIAIPEDWCKIMLPSFSLQLLVENAIKHNIISTKNPLFIKIYTDSKYLCVKNVIAKRNDAVIRGGKGLANLSTRFKLLKKKDILIEQVDNTFLVKLPVT